MTLTHNFQQTVVERGRRDPAFARAMLDEAATLFLNGEPDTARLILRDLVNATVGFTTSYRKFIAISASRTSQKRSRPQATA